jgi:hypothetical protein
MKLDEIMKMRKEKAGKEKSRAEKEKAKAIKEKAKTQSAADSEKEKAELKRAKLATEHKLNEEKRLRKAATEAESNRKHEEEKRKQAERKLKRQAAKSDKEVKSTERKHNLAVSKQKAEQQFVYDEELGRRVRKINDRSKTHDSACGPQSAKCCSTCACVFMFLIFPAIYAIFVMTEYKAYGWERILARCERERERVVDTFYVYLNLFGTYTDMS